MFLHKFQIYFVDVLPWFLLFSACFHCLHPPKPRPLNGSQRRLARNCLFKHMPSYFSYSPLLIALDSKVSSRQKYEIQQLLELTGVYIFDYLSAYLFENVLLLLFYSIHVSFLCTLQDPAIATPTPLFCIWGFWLRYLIQSCPIGIHGGHKVRKRITSHIERVNPLVHSWFMANIGIMPGPLREGFSEHWSNTKNLSSS